MRGFSHDISLGKMMLFLIPIVCILIGKSITWVPVVPLVATVAIFVFLLGFLQTEKMIFVLIFAMLLSPEFSVGQAGTRDIVIRIEDLLIIVFFLAWFAKTALVRHDRFLFNTPIQKYIIFYSSIFVFATFYGVVVGTVRPLSGFFYILKYIQYFLIYYLAVALVKDKTQLKSYLKALILTFFIVGIFAYAQLGTATRVSTPFEGEGEPNTLGGYMVLLMGVILGVACHVRSKLWRNVLLSLSLFSMPPFLQTLSRSSYLSFIAMYLTLIFFCRAKRRNVLIGALIIAVIVSFFAFPQSVKDRVLYTFFATPEEIALGAEVFGVKVDPSSTERIVSWGIMFKRWQKKPFFGYGVTGQGFIDSQYVRVLVEMGAVGFFAFLLLLFAIARNSYHVYRHSKDDTLKGLAIGFFAGHIGMVTHGITANTYVLIRIMEPYWFLVALVMMIPKVEEELSLTRDPIEAPHQTSVQRSKSSVVNRDFLLQRPS